MDDHFDERPDAAQLEAAKAEIIAFRKQHHTLGTAALATAFIEQRGTATSTELSVLLGLAADEYPSVVLRRSVQGERLACVGRVWTLGPKAVPSTREQDKVGAADVRGLPGELLGQLSKPAQQLAAQNKLDALESGTNLGKREQKPVEVPRFAEKDAGKPLQALKQSLAEPLVLSEPTRCRFAVWSDGKVEIEFPSLPSVVLSTKEFKDLVRFVGTLP